MLSYQTTPIQEISDPVFADVGVRLFVKREDLNHAHVSGNKWWKLKYNIEAALSRKYETLLTFGGAFSNHIYATAAAASDAGIKSIGIIRGEQVLPLNETLAFAAAKGMHLHYVSREVYRNRGDANFILELERRFGRYYLVPEGGSNELGVAGVASFAQTLPSGFDFICCPVGTGATLAGLVRGCAGRGIVLGVVVLKGGDQWISEIEKYRPQFDNWQLFGDYHFGGYAKSTEVLQQFIQTFTSPTGIPIEHVYSAKMFFGLRDLASRGYFKRGSKVLAIHTGGIRLNADAQ